MKRVLVSFILVVAVAVLTGCGAGKEEILTCTMSTNQSNMVMNQELEAKFVGNEVVDLSLDVEVELDEIYAPYMETMKTTLANQFQNYSNNGAEVDIEAEGSTVKVEIDFDLKGMSLEQKKNLDMIDVYGTKSATKKELEKAGYTCR